MLMLRLGIVNVCPIGRADTNCPLLKCDATCPLAVSLYIVKFVEAVSVKFSFTAVSMLVIMNVTETPAGTVMLLSFGPGLVVFVASIGAVPFACEGITNAS